MKNSNLATPAAVLAIPPKPKTAAMIAMMKKKIAQPNMSSLLKNTVNTNKMFDISLIIV